MNWRIHPIFLITKIFGYLVINEWHVLQIVTFIESDGFVKFLYKKFPELIEFQILFYVQNSAIYIPDAF